MKNVLLVFLLLAPAWTASSGTIGVHNSTDGYWRSAGVVDEEYCLAGRLCVEWHDPGSSQNGTLCCMYSWEISGARFGDCQNPIAGGPRPPGNPA